MTFSGPVHVENWLNDQISRARINVKIDDRVGFRTFIRCAACDVTEPLRKIENNRNRCCLYLSTVSGRIMQHSAPILELVG